jgi:hypothetical protein
MSAFYPPKFYLIRWLGGWVQLAQGLAVTLSLGFWQPGWEIRYEWWFLEEADKGRWGGEP